MVYLGVNSNNGSSSSSGQNKNGSRSPDLVDIDTDKPNDRNGGNIYLYYITYYRHAK